MNTKPIRSNFSSFSIENNNSRSTFEEYEHKMMEHLKSMRSKMEDFIASYKGITEPKIHIDIYSGDYSISDESCFIGQIPMSPDEIEKAEKTAKLNGERLASAEKQKLIELMKKYPEVYDNS